MVDMLMQVYNINILSKICLYILKMNRDFKYYSENKKIIINLLR